MSESKKSAIEDFAESYRENNMRYDKVTTTSEASESTGSAAKSSDESTSSAQSAIRDLRAKSTGTKAKPSTSNSSPEDAHTRRLMLAMKTLRPLIIASLFQDKGMNNYKPLFSMTEPTGAKASLEDKQVKLSSLWKHTESLTKHSLTDLQSAGIDLAEKGNRWFLRMVIQNNADLVGLSFLNQGQVDINVLKMVTSHTVSLITGKAVPGITEAQTQKAIQLLHEQTLETMGPLLDIKDTFDSSDRNTAISLAQYAAATKVFEMVNRFDYYQSHKGEAGREELITSLMGIITDSASKSYQASVATNDKGNYSEQHAKFVTPQTRHQLLMRCMADATSLTLNTYERYASHAIHEIRNAEDADTRGQIKSKHLEHSAPLEQIKHDVKQARQLLLAAAVPGVHYLSQLLDKNVSQSAPKQAQDAQAKAQPAEQHKPKPNSIESLSKTI